MTQIKCIAQELEYESNATRKLLERIPEEHLEWRPHPKSFTLGGLASHIAESPGWVRGTFDTETFELPADYKPYVGASKSEILCTFDANLADALEVLNNATDEEANAMWKMTQGGNVIMEMPRITCMRSMILNHLYHHRGQLTVYLRMKDVPLPATYGPSADEQS